MRTIGDRFTELVKATWGLDSIVPTERARRFLEEAIEAAQACGVARNEVEKLTTRVYAHAAGFPTKEIGQASLTLMGLAFTMGVDMDAAAEEELQRLLERGIEQGRARREIKRAEGLDVA